MGKVMVRRIINAASMQEALEDLTASSDSTRKEYGMSNMNRKQILGAITATTLLSTTGMAMASPQGLYSADELMDADVYLQNDDSKVIGEVEDILLDDNMQVAALVVESDDVLGLDDQRICHRSRQVHPADRTGR